MQEEFAGVVVISTVGCYQWEATTLFNVNDRWCD